MFDYNENRFLRKVKRKKEGEGILPFFKNHIAGLGFNGLNPVICHIELFSKTENTEANRSI